MNAIKNFLANYSFTQVWVLVFLLTLLIILAVQLVLLPYILPAWHAGDGLLIGGDWIAFHNAAVKMAENIKDQGWSQWELWPNGWLPAGIASAFYAITWPKPWVIAPLNAAVHAFTAIIVIKILLIFTKNRSHALIAALPFLFFPSAMLWYTQIHRDGYNILGMLMLLYALLLVLKREREGEASPGKGFNSFGRSELAILLTAFAGIALLWFSRPHTLILFQYTSLLSAFFIVVYFLFIAFKRHGTWKELLIKSLLLTAILLFFIPFTLFGGDSKYEIVPRAATYQQDAKRLWASATGPLNFAAAEPEQEHEQPEILIDDFQWRRTPLLPERIDNQLYSIASTRAVWFPRAYSGAASYIDRDVTFHSAVDFIYYLPRALQIAYLSPFPGDWFGEGTHGSTTFFRRVSAFEMIFIYFALIAFGSSLWRWRNKIELYLVFFYCTILMLPMVYGIPNMGTIYRYRYGYIMLIVSLGLLSFLSFLAARKNKVDRERTG